MKMKIHYLEHALLMEDDVISVLEVENKRYFFRIVKELYDISMGEMGDNIKFFDLDFKELNYAGKIRVILNYFDFEFDSKKVTGDMFKYISSKVSEVEYDRLIRKYQQLVKEYSHVLNRLDLPITVKSDCNVETITKIMKLQIDSKNSLLEDLLLLIDLEKLLKSHEVLFFVNLKQYLSKEEVKELYKYSLYNQVKIVLIDSQCYGGTWDFEKKLIIDNNLDEFMI